jgi:hypothetical protein
MSARRRYGIATILCATLAAPAAAQLTTGTVTGAVEDGQGLRVPGATVVLISQARGTRGAPAITDASGEFILAGVLSDTYTVEVSLTGFKSLTRPDVAVSGGDRVSVGTLRLEVGGATETVQVTSEVPLIQARSGERSFTVASTEVQELPLTGRNFTELTLLTPGVSNLNGDRLGGGGQNNIMIDGVSSVDTGSNTQMLQMNVDAIAEVKVLTSGYQAEYGRSSGLQISAVTKTGTNQFRGSVYDLLRDSDWNSNSWANRENGVAKDEFSESDWGYTVGGPIGRPGGRNKLFFFHSMEFRPRTGGGDLVRLRLPTALERAGDFSQSLDNNGAFIGAIRDPQTGQPFPGNVIPADRIYGPGQAVLNWWPLQPNLTQSAGTSYNTEYRNPTYSLLQYQPAVTVDYLPTSPLRLSFRYTGHNQQATTPVVPGSIPGWNDTFQYHGRPWRLTYSASASYTINSTTFLEATYGVAQNTLGDPPASDSANRYLAGLGDVPLLYPEAGVLDPDSYQAQALSNRDLPFFQDGRVDVAPIFSWGTRIGTAPPNLPYPAFLNLNRTQDVSINLTKVVGRHTFKTGFYLNHAYKAQNLTAGSGGTRMEGELSFANDSNNPFDTGFGFSNALIGAYQEYAQSSRFLEGNFISNNVEGFAQDNWKVNNRLTLDYGVRLVHQQPIYDQGRQGSSFFVDRWSADAAPALFGPACATTYPCSGSALRAVNPLTGQTLPAGSASIIGQAVPDSGDPLNGLVPVDVAPNNFAGYEWPTLAVAPRFGAAYDATGDQTLVFRGGAGLFFDRPRGGTSYASIGNPPSASSTVLNYGLLSNLGGGGLFSRQPVSAVTMYEFDNTDSLPASWQWNAGVQMALPHALSLDVSYVGQHSYERTGDGGSLANSYNLNAVDFGTAYAPEMQDPTKAASAVPGASAFSNNLLRPYPGFANINVRAQAFYHTYHSLQTSLQRRFVGGFSMGFNYTLALSETSNEGLIIRLQHAADGSVSERADNAEYQRLNDNPGLRRHVLRGNFVWDLPDLTPGAAAAQRILAAAANDWQVSGVWTGGSGATYTPTFAYQSGGQNVNLTGSPDYAAAIVLNGDPGSGCSGDRYRMFDTSVFSGPTYGSLGLESGRNYLSLCSLNIWDVAVSRNVRMGGGRSLQFRVDIFNLFNTVVFNSVASRLDLVSPASQTVRNAQYDAAGNLNPDRLRPQAAGFGAANGALPLRSVQLQIRFRF